jgi:hypothetical protein
MLKLMVMLSNSFLCVYVENITMYVCMYVPQCFNINCSEKVKKDKVVSLLN